MVALDVLTVSAPSPLAKRYVSAPVPPSSVSAPAPPRSVSLPFPPDRLLASAVPLIGWVHHHRGFEGLFQILAAAASAIFVATLLLPALEARRLARAG